MVEGWAQHLCRPVGSCSSLLWPTDRGLGISSYGSWRFFWGFQHWGLSVYGSCGSLSVAGCRSGCSSPLCWVNIPFAEPKAPSLGQNGALLSAQTNMYSGWKGQQVSPPWGKISVGCSRRPSSGIQEVFIILNHPAPVCLLRPKLTLIQWVRLWHDTSAGTGPAASWHHDIWSSNACLLGLCSSQPFW